MEKPAKKLTVKELQKVLSERGVSFGNEKKAALELLVEKAFEHNIEVDPDGLLEDREEVLADKLRLEQPGEMLANPEFITCTTDITQVPLINAYDIFIYRQGKPGITNALLRKPETTESCGMAVDGLVREITVGFYTDTPFLVLKGKVEPRTRACDPVTKLPCYSLWIIIENTPQVKSALCVCKGGMDGYCRHVEAVLYELMFYQDDSKKQSGVFSIMIHKL